MPDVGRFIMVIGMPSGGTSAVSRTLIALGVNMGRVRRRHTRSRAYGDFECVRLQRIMRPLWDSDRDWEGVCREVHAYIERRMRHPRRPQGAKFPAFARIVNAPEPLWRSLPIRIVNVARPLEEVLASNIDKLGQNKAAGKREEEVRTVWAERERLLAAIPPVHTISYSDLVADPIGAARAMGEALGLRPLVEGERRAVRVLRAVNPNLRKFGREKRPGNA